MNTENTKTNSGNENMETTKMKLAQAIVNHGPTIAQKGQFPMAYLTVGVFWMITVIACLLLADVFTTLIPSSVDTTHVGFLTLVIYGVVIYAGIKHARETVGRVFSWFPAVHEARQEKIAKAALAKCPCAVCPAKCKEVKIVVPSGIMGGK